MSIESTLSYPFQPEALPADGGHRRIVATPEERAAIAGRFGILGLSVLEADLRLKHWRKDGVHVEGRLRAVLEQACVVTLEPVQQTIDEDFEVNFVPAGSPLAERLMERKDEIAVDPLAEDPPDIYEGSTIDLGVVVEEQLALMIDPYPRAPGAALADELPAGQDGDKPDSPFAVLAGLTGRGKAKN